MSPKVSECSRFFVRKRCIRLVDPFKFTDFITESTSLRPILPSFQPRSLHRALPWRRDCFGEIVTQKSQGCKRDYYIRIIIVIYIIVIWSTIHFVFRSWFNGPTVNNNALEKPFLQIKLKFCHKAGGVYCHRFTDTTHFSSGSWSHWYGPTCW